MNGALLLCLSMMTSLHPLENAEGHYTENSPVRDETTVYFFFILKEYY